MKKVASIKTTMPTANLETTNNIQAVGWFGRRRGEWVCDFCNTRTQQSITARIRFDKRAHEWIGTIGKEEKCRHITGITDTMIDLEMQATKILETRELDSTSKAAPRHPQHN